MVVTGEGDDFVSFVVKYPYVLWQLFIFSLCSAVGQVTYYLHANKCNVISNDRYLVFFAFYYYYYYYYKQLIYAQQKSTI